MADYSPHQKDRTLGDLRFIVQFMAAAQYVDDPTIFTEFLTWPEELLRCRGVPRAALVLGIEALLAELQIADPQGGRLAREGLEFLTNLA